MFTKNNDTTCALYVLRSLLRGRQHSDTYSDLGCCISRNVLIHCRSEWCGWFPCSGVKCDGFDDKTFSDEWHGRRMQRFRSGCHRKSHQTTYGKRIIAYIITVWVCLFSERICDGNDNNTITTLRPRLCHYCTYIFINIILLFRRFCAVHKC